MAGHGNHDAFLFHAFAFKAQFDTQLCGRHFDELTYGVLHTGRDNEIFRLFLLQHHPLHFHVVFGMAPVTQGVHVAQMQAGFQALCNVGDSAGDFAGHEGFAAARGFVVEQNAVARVHAVGFTVVYGDPVSVQFRDRIRRARVERCGFFLRDFLHQAIQLRGGCLIETGFLLQTQEADGFQQAQGAHGVHVCGVFRGFEGDRYVAHRTQVVHFVRLHFLQDTGQVGGIGQVAIVQVEFRVAAVRILVDMVNALGIEGRRAAFDTVDFITFLKQKLSQIGAILSGYAGNESNFTHNLFFLCLNRTLPGSPGRLLIQGSVSCSPFPNPLGLRGEIGVA
ncbi:phytase family [Cronobacter sakazakii 696]|nr:phytase family [Cronobacter sakazakii 696]